MFPRPLCLLFPSVLGLVEVHSLLQPATSERERVGPPRGRKEDGELVEGTGRLPGLADLRPCPPPSGSRLSLRPPPQTQPSPCEPGGPPAGPSPSLSSWLPTARPDLAPPLSPSRAGAGGGGGGPGLAAPGPARAGRVQAAGASAARAPRRPGSVGARRRPGLRLPPPAAGLPLPGAGRRGGRPRPRAPGPRPPRPRSSLEAALGRAAAAAAAGGASRRLPRPAASNPGPARGGGRPGKPTACPEEPFYLDGASLSQSDLAVPLTSRACASTVQAGRP